MNQKNEELKKQTPVQQTSQLQCKNNPLKKLNFSNSSGLRLKFNEIIPNK